MTEVRFDDLDALQAQCSGDFGPFGPEVEVTQEMIDRFADLTGDHQWIHVDVERAQRESPFGGTIVHGYFLTSLLPALAPDTGVKVVGAQAAFNYGDDKTRFVSAVPAGSTVHARGRLIGAERKGAGTLVKTELAIHVVGKDKPAVLQQMLVMYV